MSTVADLRGALLRVGKLADELHGLTPEATEAIAIVRANTRVMEDELADLLARKPGALGDAPLTQVEQQSIDRTVATLDRVHATMLEWSA
jgi:hypothetical protein